MYKARDLLELKRRLSKEECSVQQFCACYVDSEKCKISRINTKFLTLEDEEYQKWLEIMKKIYAPKELYNKNLFLETNLDFDDVFFQTPLEEGGFSNEWLDTFYDMVIDAAFYVGRYIILLWYDCYDYMARTSDNIDLDESENVYKHISCAICPVELEKQALAYNPETSGFVSKERRWEIKNPMHAFVYPAFIDRTAEYDKIMYYTESSSWPEREFLRALGIKEFKTTSEYKNETEALIEAVCEDYHPDKIWMNLSYRCSLIIEEDKKLYPAELKALLELDEVPENLAQDVAERYERLFKEHYPYCWQLADKKQINIHCAIEKHNKKLTVLTKANTFIRDNHGTNDLTSEIDKILDSERMA